MNGKKVSSSIIPNHPVVGFLMLAGFLLLLPAAAKGEPNKAAETIFGILIAVPVLAALGLGLGTFGFLTNHIFKKRSCMTYRVLCVKPGLSFLLGCMVTLVGLGLLMIFGAKPGLQLLLTLAYLVGLAMFAGGATTRFVAHLMDPAAMKDEVPTPFAHIKAGLILLVVNILPLLGSLLFFGILLAGIGATLLGYFANLGRAAASIAATEETTPKA